MSAPLAAIPLSEVKSRLDRVRPPRRPIWVALFAAGFAAMAGIAAAAVMILGPTGAMPAMSHAEFVQSEQR